MKRNARRIWIVGCIVIALLTLTIILTVLRCLVFRPFKVSTSTMHPTLHGQTVSPDGTITPGDHIFANSLIYLTDDPHRGDIVVFSTSEIQHPGVRKNAYFIKRIVAIPGDVVSIDPPRLVVNGAPLLSPSIFDFMAHQTNSYGGYFLGSSRGPGERALLASISDQMTLKTDEYLVLGDNSASSLDGRHFGPIKRDSIVGKVTWRYYPFDRAGTIR